MPYHGKDIRRIAVRRGNGAATTLRLGICRALFALALLPLSGCQNTYQQISLGQNAKPPRLKGDATAYVAIPPDVWFKKAVAFDSGKLTALAVRDAFARYVKRAYLARRVESFDESLKTARDNKCTYLIYPSVLRWEDRATEFTGQRDKIEIKIQVVEAASGESLDTSVLRGASRWMTDGGDVPQDLLAEPVNEYVATLFHVVHVPSALR